MAELGIRKIKLTGGEPLVRPRMPQLVEKLKNMPLDEIKDLYNKREIEK